MESMGNSSGGAASRGERRHDDGQRAVEVASIALPVGFALREFVIDGVVGEGGFSIVYIATDTTLGRQVAIKEYLPTGLASRQPDQSIAVQSEKHRNTYSLGLRSFVNEARLLAQFDHPAFAQVHRFWEERGTAYMVMPYYEGQTLKAWRAAMAEPPSESDVRAVAATILDGLRYLHERSCLHRDIAPDNILLLPDGSPLMLDFGAARQVIGDRTQILTIILKPGYAPLEQYAETPSVKQGPWTDVYALSAVLYFLISGHAPVPATGRSILDELLPARKVGAGRYSDELLGAIDAGLSVRPERRPQDIASFAALFNAFGPPGVEIDDDQTVILPAGDESALRNYLRAAADAPAPSTSAPRKTAAAPPVPSTGAPRKPAPVTGGLPRTAGPTTPRRDDRIAMPSRPPTVGGPRPSVAGSSTGAVVRTAPVARPAAGPDRAAAPPLVAAPATLAPGSLIAGRFEILARVGAGPTGTVYCALDRNTGHEIAIKVLLPNLLVPLASFPNAIAQARIAGDTPHPNVVPLLSILQEGRQCSLVTEHLHAGQSLRTWLDGQKAAHKKPRVADVLRIAGDVCRGLEHAQERVVHGDIKPENIWLAEDGHAKVMDFGTTRFLDPTRFREAAAAAGRAGYLPPDPVQAGTAIDAGADAYAVAAVLYEMLTGGLPAAGQPPLARLRPDVPAATAAAIERGLSKDPKRRYRTAGELRAALAVRRVMPAWFGDRKIVAIAAGVGVAVVGIGLVSIGVLGGAAKREEAARAATTRLRDAAAASVQRLDEQARAIAGAAVAASGEVQRLQARVAALPADADQSADRLALARARDAEALAKGVDLRFRNALAGPAGIGTLRAQLVAGGEAMAANHADQARSDFDAVERTAAGLASIPDAARNEVQTQRAALVARLDGKWSDKDCASSSLWHVEGGKQLRYDWPGLGSFEEEVVQAADGRVVTVGVAPEKYKGHLSEYEPSDTAIEVHLANGKVVPFKKCA
jgi:serine/threonine protein kinase